MNAPPLGEPVAVAGPRPTPQALTHTGRRVGLRPPEPDRDAADLYPAAHGGAESEALWTYLGTGPFASESAMRAWLVACAGSRDPLFSTVVETGSGRAVGMAAYLRLAPEHGRIEIGHLWYAPRWQRTGVNTETVYLLLAHAFDALGYRRVEWKCDALNAPSRRAALRLGFRFEGIFRQHMIVKGRNRDTAWYALTDGEWPAVRRALVNWLASDGSVPLARFHAETEEASPPSRPS